MFCLNRPKLTRTCIFFFQAEDGIRDWSVTGVQTCALPIFAGRGGLQPQGRPAQAAGAQTRGEPRRLREPVRWSATGDTQGTDGVHEDPARRADGGPQGTKEAYREPTKSRQGFLQDYHSART